MKIKPTVSSSLQSTQQALSSCLQFVWQAVMWVFLPHMALSAVVFVLAAVALYQVVKTGFPQADVLLVVWTLFLFVFFGAVAFLYAVVASGLFALRTLSVRMEDFVYGLFAEVKQKISSKIASMDEGVAKEQAKILLADSLAEVVGELKRAPMSSVGGLLARGFLSMVSFIAKSVFIGRIMELSGATVSMSAVFASRVTLVGAILLNMSLICTVLLWGLYLLGVLVFGGSVWFVFAGK